MTHQLTPPLATYVDKRRAYKDDQESRVVVGSAFFTANAGGTTSTIVGALAAYPGATATNVVRIGDEFKLYNSSGVLKEEKVFRVTNIAVAASTTVTFTPAAATATASGDNCRPVDSDAYGSSGNMDRRLVELGYTAARVAQMTENDKMYALRTLDDPGSLP
jgi:hypothetical protein